MMARRVYDRWVELEPEDVVKLHEVPLEQSWARQQLTGMRLLQLTILEDAIRVFLKGPGKSQKNQAEFREADWYVRCDRYQNYVFSLHSICTSFCINPEALRERMIAKANRQQTGAWRVRTRPNVRRTGRIRPKRRGG